jgi:menaquinone-specific isochorismate synthase
MRKEFGAEFGKKEALGLDLGSRFVAEFLREGAILGLGEESAWVGWGPSRGFASWGELAAAGATSALFAPDFYMRSPLPWLAYRSWGLIERSRLRSLLHAWPSAEPATAATAEAVEVAEIAAIAEPAIAGLNWREPQLEPFSKAFAHVQRRIAQNRLDKAVPVVFARADGPVEPSSVARLLARALAAPSQLRPYGAWSARDGGILGATPETLFRQSSPSRLETVALAGTRVLPLDAEAADAFLHDPKERAEHQFVVNDLLAALGKRGRALASETYVAELPTLAHLRTDISVELDDRAGFADLIRDLHPTPSLGVAPRQAGLAALLEFDDPDARGRFGAPFGVYCEEPFISDCLVAIRCAQWRDSEVAIGSGCGLVAASALESEWLELGAKRDSVRRILGI